MKESLLYIALTCVMVQCAHAADLTFDTNPKTVSTGVTFTLDIIGTGFPLTEGGGAEFTFNPAILEVRSVSVDSTVWDVYTSQGTIDNVNGSVRGVTVATFADPGADFIVATIEFNALGAGVTDLVLSENPFNQWSSGGNLIAPGLTDGSVIVTSSIQPDGDLAPRGNPDGIINGGDYLVALQIALGNFQPTLDELAHGDVFPPGQGDNVINVSDLILILDLANRSR